MNLLQETAEGIVNSLFPYEEEPAVDVDASLDVIVSRVCLDLINDIPAGDPRWAPIRRSEISISSSSSLQILNQLEDKQRAVEWFFSFLRETKLWDRVSSDYEIMLADLESELNNFRKFAFDFSV